MNNEEQQIKKWSIHKRSDAPRYTLGEIIIVTGAKTMNPRVSNGTTRFEADGWHSICGQGGENGLTQRWVFEKVIRGPVEDEISARLAVLKDGLSNMLGNFYAEAGTYEAFNGWRLTIACANNPFLAHLEEGVDDDESALFNALRKFGKVSVASCSEDIVREVYLQRLLSPEQFQALRK